MFGLFVRTRKTARHYCLSTMDKLHGFDCAWVVGWVDNSVLNARLAGKLTVSISQTHLGTMNHMV